MEIAAGRQRTLSRVLGLAGRHARPAEIDASRRVLLPLPPREETGKLRENVRAAEIRSALVGHVLHEIAKPLQRRKSRGGAALAAQRSRRARPTLNSFPDSVLSHGLKVSGAQARCWCVTGFAQQFIQNFRDLEDGPIIERVDILT